jgi:hypothetical protein
MPTLAKMRCACYYHAQSLLRRGTPIWLAPEAKALHKLPPVVSKRTRQGYDVVAACSAGPSLPEACWARLGVFSVPLFYALHVWLDWRRLGVGWRDLELDAWQMIVALPLFPLFRLLHTIGMARIFLLRGDKGGWGGLKIPQVIK